MLLPARLVCTHAFHGYARGQEVTNPAEIKRLLHDDNRGHHFVKAGGFHEWEEPKAIAVRVPTPAPAAPEDPAE